MQGLADFVRRAHAAKLDVLLIGGHAVALHGIQRNTYDVDVMVEEGDFERWAAWLKTQGYSLRLRTDAFAQFRSESGKGEPVDLMLVASDTREKIASQAQVADVEGIAVRVPSALHLVAMKCHAIRYRANDKAAQDWTDMVGLVKATGLDVRDDRVRGIVLKYAGPEAQERLERELGR